MASKMAFRARAITKIMPSDDCKGIQFPWRWYDFHEFGWHLGNVSRRRVAVVPQIRIASMGDANCAEAAYHSQAGGHRDRKFMAVWIGNPGMALAHADILERFTALNREIPDEMSKTHRPRRPPEPVRWSTD